MFRRSISVFVVPALLLLAMPGFASARTATKRHKVNVSGYIDTVTSNGATGVPGSTETDAGSSPEPSRGSRRRAPSIRTPPGGRA